VAQPDVLAASTNAHVDHRLRGIQADRRVPQARDRRLRQAIEAEHGAVVEVVAVKDFPGPRGVGGPLSVDVAIHLTVGEKPLDLQHGHQRVVLSREENDPIDVGLLQCPGQQSERSFHRGPAQVADPDRVGEEMDAVLAP
jgi:hypothetical protein